MPKPSFRFKQFTIQQDRCALKVGTDGVLFRCLGEFRCDPYPGYRNGNRCSGPDRRAAQRKATIDAVEIDDAAAEQAAENAAASPWSGRVHVHRMDVRRMHSTDPFDLIICNPPYYEGYSPAADDRVGVAKHSNELRFQELVEAVERLLAPGGRLAVIIPLNREAELLAEADRIGWGWPRNDDVRYVTCHIDPPSECFWSWMPSGGTGPSRRTHHWKPRAPSITRRSTGR
jgi:tRNA1Val (adenine37-N6)-methyltransferase